MDKLVLPGDILRANEAIASIPDVDLGPPIEIPELPAEPDNDEYTEEEKDWLIPEINRLTEEYDALLLGHNYQRKKVQKICHYADGPPPRCRRFRSCRMRLYP